MRKMRLFLVVLLFSGALCCQTTRAQETDPVRIIWAEFMDSPNALDEIDEWVEKILLVIEQNPTSTARGNVLRNLAGSCSSAERQDKAIELLLRVLSVEDRSYWRLISIGYLGAIHKELYLTSTSLGDNETAKKHAESVLKYYEQYTKEFDSTKIEDLADWQREYLQQRQVFFKRTEAELFRDVRRDTDAALEKHDEAIALLASNPELTESGLLQGMGLDTAFFLKNKAETLLGKGDLQEAIAGMIEYGKSASTSKEVKSFIARKFAESAFPNKGNDYRDFLNRWFNEVPHDKETVVILLCIGESYFNEDSYNEAIVVFENIRTSWWQQALDLDPIALREQMGGYFTEVLRMLCLCYQKTGQLDKAVQCIDELKKLVPKDVWVPTLEQHQEHAVNEHEHAEFVRKLEAGEFKVRHYWGLIIGANFILIALIIYIYVILRTLRKMKSRA